MNEYGKLRFPSEGEIRLSEKARLAEVMDVNGVDVELYEKSFGDTVLPKKEEGVYYIVSLPVAMVVDRDDFLVPHMHVRDERGRIIASKAFARVVHDEVEL